MVIDKNVKPESFTFKDIACGDCFFLNYDDEDNTLYLALETFELSDNQAVNAVSLEDGTVFFFEDDAEIFPAKVKIVKA